MDEILIKFMGTIQFHGWEWFLAAIRYGGQHAKSFLTMIDAFGHLANNV